MSWFSLSVLSMVSTVVYEIISKKLLKDERETNPIAFASFLFFISSIFLLFFYFIFDIDVRDFFALLDLQTLSLLLLNTVLYTIAPTLYYIALQRLPLSIVTIIYSFVTILTLVIEKLFGFGVITLMNLSGCILIITAIVIVSLKSNEIKLTRNHLLIFSATVLYAFAAVFDRQLTAKFSHTFYGFLTFFLPALLILIINKVPKRVILGQYSIGNLFGVAINSFFIVISFLLIFEAYSMGGTANQVSSITSTSVIATVLFSAIFLKERKNFRLKMFAALITSIGVYLISQ